MAVLGYFLKLIFGGAWILPQVFKIGPLVLRYYGLIMALAVGAGFYLAKKRAAKYSIDPKTADDVMFWTIIGGFLGARVYHVLSSYSYYYSYPFEILKVWQGGLSIFGAILGGLITLLLCKRIYNLQFTIFKILDWLTPSIIIGQIIGRFGNLFNYEAFGYPTNLPWKMFVPENFRPLSYQPSGFFHPWFLYEQVGLLIIFLIVRKLGLSKSGPEPLAPPGYRVNLFLYYLLLYNILRFGLEFLRIDSTMAGDFRLNSIVSLFLVCVVGGVIFTKMNKNRKDGGNGNNLIAEK